MTTATVEAAGLVGWGEPDQRWLAARRTGISASDVSAVLGFSTYATPWEVWADKTGLRPREVDADKEAILLGVALEPWLLRQAGHMLGADVERTTHRLYAHPHARWRLASPDGQVAGGGVLIEAKTAGLASGYAIPAGWSTERAPLGYELQCRWQMHVLGVDRVDLVALVAGLGLRAWTYRRDLAIEADLVAQVDEWRTRHLVRGVEPPMGARDNALIDGVHPQPTRGELRLDEHPDVVELLYTYRDGLDREKAGAAVKETAGAALKRILGDHAVGTIANRPVVTWNSRRGSVNYPAVLAEMAMLLGWSTPDLLDQIEEFRNPPTRSIDVKGINA